MKTLDELTHEDFEAHIGETFGIGKAAVTLKSVTAGKPGPKQFRTQVSLIFEADSDIGVEAAVVPVSHPDLGRFDLMVHRTADPENPDNPPTYEIILN
jgi:hypothetical protein